MHLCIRASKDGLTVSLYVTIKHVFCLSVVLCTFLNNPLFDCRKELEQGEAVRQEKQTLNDTLKGERKKNESVDINMSKCIYTYLLHCKTFLGAIHREQLPSATVPRFHVIHTSYNSLGKLFCH